MGQIKHKLASWTELKREIWTKKQFEEMAGTRMLKGGAVIGMKGENGVSMGLVCICVHSLYGKAGEGQMKRLKSTNL